MKHTNKSSLYIISSLTITTLILGLVLSSASVSADNDSIVDEINITVPMSCTLSGTGMDTHSANINNGTYNSAIGETTMKAFCNDNNGFAIYAIGFTDNEDGKNVLTNSILGSTYDIITGTATGPVGSDDISQWAMKLSTITSPTPTYPIIIAGSTDDADKEQGDLDYSTFQQVPDDYTLVAKRTAGTDIGTNAEGTALTTTYQAYISKTQPAGTYTGQVKYTLVHPYDAVKPISPITIESAMGAAGKNKLNGYYKIQDLNSSICNEVNVIEGDGMTELIDVRDNNTYKVTKLKDGNCWMLENLALDPTDSETAVNMNENNTNATAAAIANYLNGGNPDSVEGWSSDAVINASSDFASENSPRINNSYRNTLVTGYGLAAINGQAKVGVYYNFCAATAGTHCNYRVGDSSQDICPINWRLPTGGSNRQYLVLSNQYYTSQNATDPTSLQYNLSLSLSGVYYYGSPSGQNEFGKWLEATLYQNDNDMYYARVLDVWPNLIWHGISEFDSGHTIRCTTAN